jgi:hypothetical protein
VAHLSKIGHLCVIREAVKHVHARDTHAEHIVGVGTEAVAGTTGTRLLTLLLLLLLLMLLRLQTKSSRCIWTRHAISV